MPIILLAFAVALGAWAFTGRRPAGSDGAIEIARQRFARGEVTTAEYDQMRAALRVTSAEPGLSPPGAIALGLVSLSLLVAGALMLVWMAAAGGWAWGGWGNMGSMMGWNSSASPPGVPVTIDGTATEVRIIDFAYNPSNIEIKIGTSVTWRNSDTAKHSATARDDSWDTGLLGKGDRATMTFAAAGSFTYYCTLHPAMAGILRVVQ